MRKQFFTVLFFLTFFSLFFAPQTHAQTKAGVSINPPLQEISLAAELPATQTAVTITNTSSVAQSVRVQALDFEQTDAQGNIRFANKPLSATQFTLARFISFPESEFLLPPAASKVVTATITNSLELSPGTHYASLIFTFTPKESKEEAKVVPALSSLLILKKNGGEFYRISLTSVTGTPLTFGWESPKEVQLILENTGNTHVTPRGVVTATGLRKKILYKGSINEASALVLPNNRRLITVSLFPVSESLPIDFVSVSVAGTLQGTSEKFFWRSSYIVVRPLAGVMLLILVVGSILWRWVHAHKK